MRKVTHSLLASALGLAMVGIAYTADVAGEPQPPLDPTPPSELNPTFEQLDTNRDGSVAKSEVPIEHELNTLFATYDHDSDQLLTRIEFDEYAMQDEKEAE